MPSKTLLTSHNQCTHRLSLGSNSNRDGSGSSHQFSDIEGLPYTRINLLLPAPDVRPLQLLLLLLPLLLRLLSCLGFLLRLGQISLQLRFYWIDSATLV